MLGFGQHNLGLCVSKGPLGLQDVLINLMHNNFDETWLRNMEGKVDLDKSMRMSLIWPWTSNLLI